jgi:hypothetical protein
VFILAHERRERQRARTAKVSDNDDSHQEDGGLGSFDITLPSTNSHSVPAVTVRAATTTTPVVQNSFDTAPPRRSSPRKPHSTETTSASVSGPTSHAPPANVGAPKQPKSSLQNKSKNKDRVPRVKTTAPKRKKKKRATGPNDNGNQHENIFDGTTIYHRGTVRTATTETTIEAPQLTTTIDKVSLGDAI